MKYKFRQFCFTWGTVVFVSVVSRFSEIPFEPYYIGFTFGFGVTGTLGIFGAFDKPEK